ncbi:MAG: class I SAM-dependent methyltransferase [Isosphaeraceae bacterium]
MSANQGDGGRTQAFGEYMVELLNHSAVTLMISVGHRTGLLDVLGQGAWMSVQQIAARAGLSERYVREWLAAMATGKVLDYNAARGLYRLPPEHAAWLTRAASPNNLATSTQWIGLMGAAEDHVVSAFRHGSGVPYEAFHRFHHVMAEESGQTVVAALRDHLLPLVPGLAERLGAGIDVLDVGCGAGRALQKLAGMFPASRFVGYDLSEQAIRMAREETETRGLANVRFEVMDLAQMDDIHAYDLITSFDVIHDQARPDAVLRGIRRALRPDGVFFMQDISGSGDLEGDMSHPLGPFLYTISCFHCMSVSLANDGPGLGAMWGKPLALKMLREAGFDDVRVESLPHDPLNFYYIAEPVRPRLHLGQNGHSSVLDQMIRDVVSL